MATTNRFETFSRDVCAGVHNFDVDNIFVALSNTKPLSSFSSIVEINEIQNGGGYETGGIQIPVFISTLRPGAYGIEALGDATLAANGDVDEFRYAIMYNASSQGGRLISWYDMGEAISLSNNDRFVFRPNGPIFTCE